MPMAIIHRGKQDPRRRMRRARTLMLLCWPVALLSLALTVLLYLQCTGRLLALAQAWQGSVAELAASPGVFREEWHAMLWQAVETLCDGAGWTVFGLTLAGPGLLGVGLAVVLLRMFAPAGKQYRRLRAQVRATDAAMQLLAPMPDSCHIFLHRKVCYEGAAIDPGILLVSQGGVAVLEVRDAPGIVEGCVTDAVLWRRHHNGDSEKIHNPARRAVASVVRLSNFLASRGLRVRVTPCVVFVHPEASAYVQPPEPHEAGGRRTLVSSCVMTDAASFWEDFGRSLASGRVLPQATAEAIVSALDKAPEGRK